jgi:hypothetical protein
MSIAAEEDEHDASEATPAAIITPVDILLLYKKFFLSFTECDQSSFLIVIEVGRAKRQLQQRGLGDPFWGLGRVLGEVWGT